MIVLGCITTNLKTAIRLAALLSRSLVQVNIRTALPDVSSITQDAAPFEIVVVGDDQTKHAQTNAAEELNLVSAVTWLKSQDTHRYWYVSDDDLTVSSTNILFENADQILSALAESGVNTACHFRPSDHRTVEACNALSESATSEKQADDMPTCNTTLSSGTSGTASSAENITGCGVVQLKQGENALEELVSSIDELDTSVQPTLRHLIVTIPLQLNRQSASSIDWITAIRATERYALIVGPIIAAEHLPAMLRIRGWLNSSHHTPRIDAMASNPTLITDDRSTLGEQHAHQVEYSTAIEHLNDTQSHSVTLITRQENNTASIAILRNVSAQSGTFSVTAAKVDQTHPLRMLYTIE